MTTRKFLAGLGLCLLSLTGHAQSRLIDWVNPLVGTDGHGHTFPGATRPFGMVQLSPDTRTEGWDACSGYHYSDSTLLGFSHTHLSGTGIADYCDVLLRPGVGVPALSVGQVPHFSHKDEQTHPGYYRVKIRETGIVAELTATARSGMHRYNFPSDARKGYVLVDLAHRDKVLSAELKRVSDTEYVGHRHSEGWSKHQELYFVVRFSKPVTDEYAISKPEDAGPKRAFVFDVADDNALLVKVGISSVSIENARENLDKENPNWDFDGIKRAAEQEWEQELSRIRVQGGTDRQRRTFYTALYHCMIAPNIMSDWNGQFRGLDGKVHRAAHTQYTVFSLWDTHRTLHPLLNWIAPNRSRDLVLSMLEDYKISGQLPVWELWGNETDCMIGNHAIPVLLDAMRSGICTEEENKQLYQAMKQSVEFRERGMEFYAVHGLIEAQNDAESVSKSLEFAFDDWCIAQAAKTYGTLDEYTFFSKRCQNWRNYYDGSTRMLRPRKNGGWLTPFNPVEVNNNYTEANAWQYNFYIPHEIETYADMVGGQAAFGLMLDKLFTTPSEMSGRNQVDITGLIGQYAHGNEPSHHVAWLYHYAGQPWKSVEMVHRILDSLYTDAPDGLCGNDDCGQLSAWYVMNALGMYPVAAGSGEYLIGVPIFDRVDVSGDQKRAKFRIDRSADIPKGLYLLDDKPLDRLFMTIEEMKGGHLIAPSKLTDMRPATPRLPISRVVGEQLTTVPLIYLSSYVSYDSCMVGIENANKAVKFSYRLLNSDDSTVIKSWADYQKPFYLNRSAIVQVMWTDPQGRKTGPASATFTRLTDRYTIRQNTPCNPMYPGHGGPLSLIDGHRAGPDFRDENWQGYHQNDLDVVLDLGEVRDLTEVGGQFLQNLGVWIWFPQELSIAASTDGQNFGPDTKADFTDKVRDTNIQAQNLTVKGKWRGRYIRIRGKAIGTVPQWHIGYPERGHLFISEIIVK